MKVAKDRRTRMRTLSLPRVRTKPDWLITDVRLPVLAKVCESVRKHAVRLIS